MARTDNFTNFATDVADSIRSMTGKTGKIPASQFDTEIKSINVGTSEDLTEELNTYDTNLTTQETTLEDIVKALQGKASGGGSGELATGIVVSELNENGLPKTITINNATVPNYCFYGNSTSNQNILTTNLEKLIFKNTLKTGANICYNCKNLKEVVFDDTLEEIETYAFYNCYNATFQFSKSGNLKTIGQYAFQKSSGISYIPESVTTLENGAYYQTTNNTIKTIPDSITELSESVFRESDITQMSMNNVTIINGGASLRGTFNSTQSLKALWIGSEIISIGRYALNNSTVTKIFIDRPKAGIESLSYYSTKWSNNTLSSDCQIIGNDEEGFMTKEEFDSIDWATHTG